MDSISALPTGVSYHPRGRLKDKPWRISLLFGTDAVAGHLTSCFWSTGDAGGGALLSDIGYGYHTCTHIRYSALTM